MNRFAASCAVAAIGAFACAQRPHYEMQGLTGVLKPDTSIERPGDAGRRAHTNHLIYMPDYVPQDAVSMMLHGPARQGSTYYVPSQINSAYGLPGTGGSGIIAIVDAFRDPNLFSDFNTFSSEFGLPVETSTTQGSSKNKVFQIVYATGHQPPTDGGWGQEESLDVEWAHAMAPSAKIVIVEAASNSLSDLLTAETVAAQMTGVKEVTNSWGSGEFSSETAYDGTFVQNGVVFFASAGDTGGAQIWPSTSPNVVSCGGTSLRLNSNGTRSSETAWSGGGGGPSSVETIPSYQSGIASIVGTQRGTPDISFDADPNTGVVVYDSYAYGGLSGWLIVGGTSVSSPCLAGCANEAAHHRTSSVDELTNVIYHSYATHNYRYFDVVSGTAGSFSCTPGWDFVTGVGTLVGNQGI
jgi:subtilase family serine protease